MIVPASVRQRFSNSQSSLDTLSRRVDDIVFKYCRNWGFPYLSRLKSIESLSEKIESGRYEKWTDIDDLFACSIIVPKLTLEAKVLEVLRKEFIEIEVRSRDQTNKPPDAFRFDCTRFIGRLRPIEG